MKAVVQRVKSSKVTINDRVVGNINKGFNVLFGAEEKDTKKDADYLARKISNLRVFEDENGKMNLSIKDIGGQMLIISQFTLAADTKKGNRPSFVNAMEPVEANELYEYFMKKIEEEGISVKRGIFGEDMLVDIVNDGPVTILFDTKTKE
ncbi:D-aminoacyl-tRNA deacylase [Anaerofustis stercorihominis]|uniref:D-aminoacyl-tRNA deacylase n=1 Tax=Anaerofustis stercorihominis DSM 17244 TaxID=445971 RepID=B1C9I0_9FIRM|nr:D-aminoacyl-tRNA deacylase [Anaerofustis stercorihominis]EDS72551.1 D-tyrosyl-tRNA(Tyr) deacylase [Anaerofustis stercorihominis DSM 17244]MCQ4795215.1 D-aminoacyl-tRNA deacylase [Anaerofustis stercorihominis]